MVQCPHRWNIHSLRRFMVVFGVISSVFDYITFFYLLKILKSSQDVFRTGWFIQSVLTELLALLILRSRQSVFKSRIGKGLWITSLLIAILTISLPYIPGVSSLLSITPLPLPLMVSLIGITLLYSLANENREEGISIENKMTEPQPEHNNLGTWNPYRENCYF